LSEDVLIVIPITDMLKMSTLFDAKRVLLLNILILLFFPGTRPRELGKEVNKYIEISCNWDRTWAYLYKLGIKGASQPGENCVLY